VAKDAVKHEQDTIMVFTARSPERIIREGGSGAWRLSPVNAGQMTYVVCTQNRHNPDDYFDATEPHGTAFLIGRHLTVRKARECEYAPGEDPQNRYVLCFSEYALIDIPNLWDGLHNPVRYTSLEELGINADDLDWQPMPQNGNTPPIEQPQRASSSAPLTIQEAKKALAATFGVKPEAIEIIIHG
jgi:hypothetical protein